MVVESDGPTRAALVEALDGQVLSVRTVDELSMRTPSAPLVVVVGPSALASDGPTVVQLLVANAARPVRCLAVVDHEPTASDPDLFAAAGFADMVGPADGPEGLRARVDRLAAEMVVVGASSGVAPSGTAGTLVAVVFSAKGGSGTSIVASNLAAALVEPGAGPVTLIDADGASGDLAVMLGLEPDLTLADVADGDGCVSPGVVEHAMVRHHPTGIRLLASPFEPAFATRVRGKGMAAVIAAAAETSSAVVVDTSVVFDDVLLATLAAASDLIVVATPEVTSVRALSVALQTVAGLESPPARIRVALNRAGSVVGVDAATIEDALGVGIDVCIPSDLAVPRSVNDARVLVTAEPAHPVSVAIRELAAQLRVSTPTPPPSG
ncbi:MAG: hypothetical protein S0880_15195 [Actinomycetota bacterium]|nr:hypothetical protein [Actinomycetota bacterium]